MTTKTFKQLAEEVLLTTPDDCGHEGSRLHPKQEYFVWTVEDEKVMFAKSTTDNHTVGYGANGKSAKNIIQLLITKE